MPSTTVKKKKTMFILHNLVIQLATIVVRKVPEELLKELRRLKIELGCKTWADLLSELVARREPIVLSQEDKSQMKKGVEGLLSLRNEVTRKWKGPSVLEEIRRSRRHEP